MKIICKNCGTEITGQTNFCQNCGSNQFMPVSQSNETTVLTVDQYPQAQPQQPQYGQYQQPQQPQYGQPQYGQPSPYQTNAQNNWQAPPAPEKKKNKTVIAIIVIVVLVILAAVGIFAEKVLSEQGYGYYEDDTPGILDSVTDENTVSYTKGSCDGNVYTNEWADIKITIPEEYSEVDDASYAEFSNDVTEYGLYVVSEATGEFFYVCYEKMPTFPVLSEKEYLDLLNKNTCAIEGLNAVVESTGTTVNIGGYDYISSTLKANNGITDMTEEIFVRSLDGYMITFITMSVDDGFADATADLKACVSTCK